MPTLFDEFKVTDNVRLIPAVRSPDGNCVDESGCDAEKMIACAFVTCGANFTTTNQCAVDFMDCMDSHTYTTAEKVGAICAESTGIDFQDVNACFTGDQGDDLLSEASDLFNAQYPGSAYIPAVAVDSEALDSVSQSTVEAAMCAAGSSADVCQSLKEAKSCLI